MATECEGEGCCELLWQAFRYVAGEMGGDEREAFDARLDQDQEAREAVARAVELAAAVAVAAVQPGSQPQPAPILPLRRRPLRAIAAAVTLATAACLAWLVVTVRAPLPAPAGPRQTAAITPEATVVLTWSGLSAERESDREDATALIAWNDGPPAPAETDDGSDLGLPLWLVDAASLGKPGQHAGAPAKEL
jgi:hypothetical protein